MHADSERQKLFSRRIAMLAGGKLLLCGVLAGRMYYLQVIESERFNALADENRFSLRLLEPPRGRIVDRFGAPLAVNSQNYRVMMVSEDAASVGIGETLARLSSIVPMSDAEVRKILREISRNRSFVPITIRENIAWEEVAKVEVNAPDLPGISIDEGRSRFYPHADDLAHILGYVGKVSEKEKTDDRLLELPGFRIGKSGMEKVHDLALRGTGGSSKVEVNAYGRVIREHERREGLAGAEVRLTIDLALQKEANRLLSEEKSAAAVVMDVHTGDVLALSSMPSFDPNAFARGLSSKEWRALVNDPHTPLNNKAISGRYAPGSTFKMIVGLAALERGIVNSETEIFCEGHLEFGDGRFHCWKRRGHGTMNLHSAIQQSCDVYFYETARRIGIDRIAEMARRFGIGVETGLDLPGESKGLMPTKAWKRKALNRPWHQGETLIAGIGQGYVLTTPLQLCVMTARMVNGGRKVIPRLTLLPGGRRNVEEESASVGVSQTHLSQMLKAMDSVNNSPLGTAYKARIKDPAFAMGGKTGTSQVRRISRAEREKGVLKNAELPWDQRDHALFVGYAPVHQPRYAVSVVVQHGGGGSAVAAPIARDILQIAQDRDSARRDETLEALLDRKRIEQLGQAEAPDNGTAGSAAGLTPASFEPVR